MTNMQELVKGKLAPSRAGGGRQTMRSWSVSSSGGIHNSSIESPEPALQPAPARARAPADGKLHRAIRALGPGGSVVWRKPTSTQTVDALS